MTEEELKAAYMDWFRKGVPARGLMFSAFKAGHAAAQPKWVKTTKAIEIGKPNYPTTNEDVWCLLSNGHIVRGMFFSREIGWEWDNENDDDADATVTQWSPITPPAPPEQKE